VYQTQTLLSVIIVSHVPLDVDMNFTYYFTVFDMLSNLKILYQHLVYLKDRVYTHQLTCI